MNFTRVVPSILFAVFGLAAQPFSTAVAEEAENGRFTWLKYKEKDGTESDGPQWKSDPKKDQFVLLRSAKAEYILSEEYKLEKAELRIYKASPFVRNAFSVDPAITCTAPEAEDVATIAGPEKIVGKDKLKKWKITWIDSAKKPTSLPGGIGVKLEVTIFAKQKGKDINGVLPSTTSTAEVR